MNTFTIIPNKSVGNLKLGMLKSEIDSVFTGKNIEEKQIPHLTFKDDDKTNLIFVRYDNSKITVLYDSNHKAIEISAAINCFNPGELLLSGMDLVLTKAEDIIFNLSKCSSYTYDGTDKDLSTTYIFSDLGISLWRESGFHSKLISSTDFQNLSPENQEYEKQFMFFSSISLT